MNFFILFLIKSAQKILLDFDPIFGTIPEFKQLQTLVDFVAQINTLLATSNTILTVETFFGNSLTDFFLQKLNSIKYINTNQIVKSKLNLQRVI